MLTGFTTTIVGGRTQISQGNPDLKPERSTSFDVGAEWTSATTRFDVTVFRTVVKDRFISNVVVSNPPPPEPIVVSVANGLDAHISGLDLEAEQRLGGARRPVRQRHALLQAQGAAGRAAREQDILNVAAEHGAGRRRRRFRTAQRARRRAATCRAARTTTSTRPGFPIVDYDNFTVFDASATYRLVAAALGRARRQQPVRRVLLREARLSAAGRVVQGVVPTGLLTMHATRVVGRRRLGGGAPSPPSPPPWRSALRVPTAGTAARRGERHQRAASTRSTRPTDYFPDKATIEDAANFSVDYRRSYKVVSVGRRPPAGRPNATCWCSAARRRRALDGDLAGAQVVTVPITSLFRVVDRRTCRCWSISIASTC